MKERWESREMEERWERGREMGEREMEEVEREMGTFHFFIKKCILKES